MFQFHFSSFAAVVGASHRSRDREYMDVRSFDPRIAESKEGEFLQIISASSMIQDPDLIPLACKSLPRRSRVSKPVTDYSDLLRDHPDNLLTSCPSSAHSMQHTLMEQEKRMMPFHNNDPQAISDVMFESVRMDSISGHTMTTDSNMTSISDTMSGFVTLDGVVGVNEGLDQSPSGIVMMPVLTSSCSSSSTTTDFLMPRTSYQRTYETRPGGSMGFKRHSVVSDVGSGLHSRLSDPPHQAGHQTLLPASYQRHHHHEAGYEAKPIPETVHFLGQGMEFQVKETGIHCHWDQDVSPCLVSDALGLRHLILSPASLSSADD